MSNNQNSSYKASTSKLLQTWEAASPIDSPDSLLNLANNSLKQGEVLLAQEVLRKVKQQFSEVAAEDFTDLQLRIEEKYLLALARLGNLQSVASNIEELLAAGVKSENLHGLAGRCYKDLFLKTSDRSYLLRAFERYHEGFLAHHQKSYYLGINAASCAFALGEKDVSRDLAQRVLSLLSDDTQDAWEIATHGECLLLLDRIEDAALSYSKAAKLNINDLLSRTSMRRQARWILKEMGQSYDALDHCFEVGPLVVFAGHLPDEENRPISRFPESSIGLVRDSIKGLLKKHSPEMAYTSAAAGADLIFIECLIESGIPYHLVLPCPPEEFLKLSVLPYGKDWVDKFETSLLEAESIRQSSHREAPVTATAWTFANQCLAGFALLHSSSTSVDLMPIVVWDGKEGMPGGTQSFVDFWLERESPVHQVLSISGENVVITEKTPITAKQASESIDTQQVIRAMVFADVKGYTSLGDLQIPRFVQDFMGEVSVTLQQGNFNVLSVNTWGDAIYCVFETTAQAGNFCVELMRKIKNTRWEEKGLPEGITFRVACHAGPVFEGIDPLTQQTNFYGVHVSQTARIEPITPPGKIYASEEFSALAMMENGCCFSTEFIGHLPLAKEFGSLRIYNLRQDDQVR